MVLESVVVADNETWFAKKLIEGEIFNSMVQVASSKYGEGPILHNGNVPDIRDSRFIASVIQGRDFGIHSRDKAVELER
jgi:hypothetical protein